MWAESASINGEIGGFDFWTCRRGPHGNALVVRRATFWSALWNYGLWVALDDRSKRPLEGKRFGGWYPLGDYRGLTGWLHFDGPVTGADVCVLMGALAAKSAEEALFAKGEG